MKIEQIKNGIIDDYKHMESIFLAADTCLNKIILIAKQDLKENKKLLNTDRFG